MHLAAEAVYAAGKWNWTGAKLGQKRDLYKCWLRLTYPHAQASSAGGWDVNPDDGQGILLNNRSDPLAMLFGFHIAQWANTAKNSEISHSTLLGCKHDCLSKLELVDGMQTITFEMGV